MVKNHRRRNVAAIITLVLGGLVLLTVPLAGCARTEKPVAETETDIGEYVVCSFDSEGEFVTADGDQVPPYEYDGKTYYFSSEECREAVTSDPERYLAHSDTGEDIPDEGVDNR